MKKNAPTTPSTPPSGTTGVAVSVRSVDKAFGQGDSRTVVLKQTDFEAHIGELLMLVGPSGCGKTTLLSILAGTLAADRGNITVLGQELNHMTTAAITRFRAAHVGFIFQQFNLIPTLTVVENVSVPLLIQGTPTKRAEDRAREALAMVGIGEKAASLPGKLSGGQQQRVAIARALVHEPSLLVCDEPTSALDSENGHTVMELLRQHARQSNRTVIVVTHDPRIYSFADRMAEMEDGRIQRILESPTAIAAAHHLTLPRKS